MSVTRHLSERQRAIEIMAALYVTGFGSWVGLVINLTNTGPLNWTGWSIALQEDTAFLMCMSGLIHAVGVQVNGNWRWSPVLRLAGMVSHLIVIALIWGQAPNFSTAQYTYAWFILALMIGSLSAWRDTSLAVRHIYGPGTAGTSTKGA